MSRLTRFINESKPLPEISLLSDYNDFSCPLCSSSTYLDATIGIPICKQCGWVNNMYLDLTPEWKTIKQQQEDSVSSSVLSLGKTPISCTSSFNKKTSSSSFCSFSPSSTITTACLNSYIQNYQKKDIVTRECPIPFFSAVRPPRRKKVRFQEPVSTSSSSLFKPSINNRTFYDHCQHIAQVCANYRILRIILDRSIWWYKELLQFYKFHGFLCDALKAASLYMASMEYKYPITQKECADMFGVAKTYTTKCINLMEKHRNIIIHEKILDTLPDKIQTSRHEQNASYKVPNSLQECHKPTDYLRLFLSRVVVDEIKWTMDQTILCFFIANKVDEHQLAIENYPHCVAATILFLVSSCTEKDKQKVLNKKRICEISQTSEVTLNRCYNKLCTYKHIIVPPSVLSN